MNNSPSESLSLHFIPRYEAFIAFAVVSGFFFPLFMPIAALLVTLLGWHRLRQIAEQSQKKYWLAYTLVGLFLLLSSLFIVTTLL